MLISKPHASSCSIILRILGVRQVEIPEVPGLVFQVVGLEQIEKQVPAVEDGAVDVKQQEQRVVGKACPRAGVVLGKRRHPIGVHSLVREPPAVIVPGRQSGFMRGPPAPAAGGRGLRLRCASWEARVAVGQEQDQTGCDSDKVGIELGEIPTRMWQSEGSWGF